VEFHPAYRHVVVNVCPRLRLLDFHVVSDAELIEGATATWRKTVPKFAPFARTLECDILTIGQAAAPAGTPFVSTSESAHLQLMAAQLEIVRKQHRRFSPVLRIQALFRGILVRRTLGVYNAAATSIQHAWRKLRGRNIAYGGDLTPAAAGTALATIPRSPGPPAATHQLHPLSTLAAHTIFLVHTSDVAVSLFMQLVKRSAHTRAHKPRTRCSIFPLASFACSFLVLLTHILHHLKIVLASIVSVLRFLFFVFLCACCPWPAHCDAV